MHPVTCAAIALVAIARCVLGEPSPLSPQHGPAPIESHVADGFIVNSTHPWRPGDERKINLRLTVTLDLRTGEATLALANPARPEAPPGVYYWRRGRIFEVNHKGDEVAPTPAHDLAAATLAVIHPALLQTAMREHPECVIPIEATGHADGDNAAAIAGALWRVHTDPDGQTLSRRVHDEIRGSQIETVEHRANDVTVVRAGRILAKFRFTEPAPADPPSLPLGDPARDSERILTPEEITFIDKGGGLFACELPRLESRVFIVEFADGLLVHEGAFSTRNAATIADAAEARFHKPVKWFTFSHIHPQYIAGVRSWSARGATIIAPPPTFPLVEQILDAPFDLRPDARSSTPPDPRTLALTDRWTHADSAAEVLVLSNNASKHTDDYTIVYLPRTKTLLSGDLIFFRPGKPLGSRGAALLDFVRSAGLAPDRFIATWPLSWPGTQSEGSWSDLATQTAIP